MSPLPPHGTVQSPKSGKKASSPSYFGFAAAEITHPPHSSAGRHARQNWDYISSNARDTPTAVPVDANPDFEAFRRQAEHARFSLGHASLPALSKHDGSQRVASKHPSSRPTQENPGPFSSAHQFSDSSRQVGKVNKDNAGGKTGHLSFFDVPRHKSPVGMLSDQETTIDCRNARLSLPGTHLHTPPSDPDRKPVQRAETLPDTLHKDALNMVSAEHFITLLQSLPKDVLLLDLRVSPQYSASKIRGALNLCIPTTLMKRPSFNTQKLRDTFALESDREKFSRWRDYEFIAVYDSQSKNLKDAQSAVNVLKKFSVEGWNGQGIILKGGFAEISQTHPFMVEQGSIKAAPNSTSASLSLVAPSQTAAPVAGGCPMPSSKSAANPFFNNIRQNMDLVDGVGQMAIARPAGMSAQAENALPEWLKKAVEKNNKGKLVSDEFLAIERTEQKRMQDALNCPISYGSPRFEKPGKVQIAGVEKGAKNRYNNIFPYDHTRVHLQDVAVGDCDYINANHIKASYSNKRYIATQAPIPATFNDFWRLVWEQDVRVIVMLTAESEGGQLKSHPYWHTNDYGPLKLKLFAEKRIPLELNKAKGATARLKRPSVGQRRSTNPLTEAEKVSAVGAQQQRPPEAPFAIVRHFTLSHSNLPFQPMREVTQLQYTQWPDFGAPAHPQDLLALIEQTSKYVRGTASPTVPLPGPAEPAAKGQKPMLVHCSAGCGRTGTFCTVDSVLDMLKRQRVEAGHEQMDIDSDDDVHAKDWVGRGDVDLISKTVDDFRGQRLSMVQSLRQFVLCYETVLDWLVSQQTTDDGHHSREGERRSYHG
jgi:tyrosine-protein phosphatase 2/3